MEKLLSCERDSAMEKCWTFEGCKASLCPLSWNYERCIWYPDEDICRRRVGVPDWVRAQRKIVKVVGRCNEVGFFNVARLRKLKLIRKGIRGGV